MPKPSSPYAKVRGQALKRAWREIRGNGLSSSSIRTQRLTREFDLRANSEIRRIDRQLRACTFEFAEQRGIPIPRKGKLPRPLVDAEFKNRIVQRSILDFLQHQPIFIAAVRTPTSFCGIEGRGREHAISHLVRALDGGMHFYIRSDIKDFFVRIKRPDVTAFIQAHVLDPKFNALFVEATTTTLSNADELERRGLATLFPTGFEGVAQGSPLSPFIGNLYLRDFDSEMNGSGIVCLRYLDDFLILGATKARVTAAFRSAQRLLLGLGLEAYDLDSPKASVGETRGGVEFLGFRVEPGLISPSAENRREFIAEIRDELTQGYFKIQSSISDDEANRRGYVQTLEGVHRAVRGWANSYAFCNDRETFKGLDAELTKLLRKFTAKINKLLHRSTEVQAYRRILGVHALLDTRWKSLPPIVD